MKTLFFSLAMLFIAGIAAQAQDTKEDSHDLAIEIPEVALLDIETTTGKDLTFTFTSPTEAGNPIIAPSPSILYLNISSIKSVSDPSRTVSVNINQNLSNGAYLSVAAMFLTGVAGQFGVSTFGPIGAGLTTTQFPLIMNVGSCYTGDGAGKGYMLSYSTGVLATNYGALRASSETVTVTYTLSDN